MFRAASIEVEVGEELKQVYQIVEVEFLLMNLQAQMIHPFYSIRIPLMYCYA